VVAWRHALDIREAFEQLAESHLGKRLDATAQVCRGATACGSWGRSLGTSVQAAGDPAHAHDLGCVLCATL
jgi:hypothetical protein